MRLSYLASAASTYNGVWFKSHGVARHAPETPCALKQRSERFQGRSALTPKIPRVYDPINIGHTYSVKLAKFSKDSAAMQDVVKQFKVLCKL